MTLTRDQIQKIPKVELHRHLDGSVRYETIKDLAKYHNIDLQVSSERELIKKTKIKKPLESLQQALDCFWTTQKVQCCYEAIKRITFENVEDAFSDGVKLIELRFAPVFIGSNKDLEHDEIIEGVIDGITEGMNRYPIQVGLINILPRAFDLELNSKSTDDIIRYSKSNHKNADRICGFDLADGEDDYDLDGHSALIKKAKNAGLNITVHSGENTTAEHVKTTINTLDAQRIGHGIKIWGDDEVMNLVKERNIHLEVCPISNWLTNSVPSYDAHPIAKLLDAGVSLSLNSDDPHLMDIDLIEEYLRAHQTYGFTVDHFQKMNRMALEHSFLHDDIKREISASIFKN